MLDIVANDCLIGILQFVDLYELTYSCPTINRKTYRLIKTNKQIWKYVTINITLAYHVNYSICCNFNKKIIIKIFENIPFISNIKIQFVKTQCYSNNHCVSSLKQILEIAFKRSTRSSLTSFHLKGDKNFKISDELLTYLCEHKQFIHKLYLEHLPFPNLDSKKIKYLQPIVKFYNFCADHTIMPDNIVSYENENDLNYDLFEFFKWKDMILLYASTLKKLEIPGVYDCEHEFVENNYVAALTDIINHLPNIRVLKIAANRCKKNTYKIFQHIQNTCAELEELHLEEVWCNESDLLCLKTLPKLTKLHFKSKILTNDDQLNKTFQLLSQIPHLTHLNVGEIGTYNHINILHKSNSIKRIDFTNSFSFGIMPQNIFDFLIRPCNNLTYLDLSTFYEESETCKLVQIIRNCEHLHSIKFQTINDLVINELCNKSDKWKSIEIINRLYCNYFIQPCDAYTIVMKCINLENIYLEHVYLFDLPFHYNDKYSIHQMRIKFHKLINKQIKSLPILIRLFSKKKSQIKKIKWKQLNPSFNA